MPTERKFAISTTPGQPGYEATYSTFQAALSGIGSLDLVTLDQKIIFEIFDDYGGSTYNSTNQIDFRSWDGSRVGDNIVVIKPVAGSEFSYPDLTGSRINCSGVVNLFRFVNGSPPVDMFDIGVFQAASNSFLYRDGDLLNSIVDRCYIEWTDSIGLDRLLQLTNNIMVYKGSDSIDFLVGSNQAGGIWKANTVIIEAGANLGRVWRQSTQSLVDNNIVVIRPGATATAAFFTDVNGDNNASTDDTAPGANSFQNIVETDHFVSSSDYHLIESSALRGAGQNFFGNGYDKDIDRDDRPNAAWDIGADQFVGVAPTGPTQNAIFQGFNV